MCFKRRCTADLVIHLCFECSVAAPPGGRDDNSFPSFETGGVLLLLVSLYHVFLFFCHCHVYLL